MPLCKVFTNQITYVNTVYLQIFEPCKYQGCYKFSFFAIIFSRIISSSKICGFHEHSLINFLHMCMTSSLVSYLLLSRTTSRSLRLVTSPLVPLISGLMHRKCPQNISQFTIGAIQNGLKSGQSGGHFRDCLDGHSC